MLLRLFHFSLEGTAKQWSYQSKDQSKTWRECSKAFLEKLFPIGRTNILRGKISEFQQQKGESIPEAWERFQGYISDCLHHEMEKWLLLLTFYYGLTQRSCEQLDATAEGSFLSLTPRRAKAIMAKMEENHNGTFNTQTCHGSKEVPEELCALSTKMVVLFSWLE